MHHALELGQRQVDQVLAHICASVVDQDVRAAELVLDLFRDPRHVGLAGDVGEEIGRLAAGRLDARLHALQLAFIAGYQGQGGAGFRQTKHVALLKDPLVSTGRFTFERPDRVRWEMVTPEPLIVEIAGASLRAGPPGAVADVDAGPAVGLFRDLGGIFAGASDYAGEQRFTLASGTSGPWSFLLTPRDPSVARVIRAIDIELDPATGGPRRVAITESSGDRTEIELVDVVVERAAGDGAPS